MARQNNRKRLQTHRQVPKPESTGPVGASKGWMTDAIILAALSIFAYTLHYFFQYGYLSYFDVPTALISFDLSTIIPAIFFLVLLYLIIAYALWPLIIVLMGALPKYLQWFILVIPWLVILIFLGFSWQAILLFFFGILLFLAVAAINRTAQREATLAIGEPEPNPKAWRVEEIEPAPTETTAFLAVLNRKLRYRKGWLLFYLFLTAILSSVAFGRITAMTRTEFPVLDMSPRCAIVYTTANRFICLLFTENEFENAFKVLYFEENQTQEFRVEDIGPLRPDLIP